VWATKYRQDSISPTVEKILFEIIREKSLRLNSPIHAMNTAHNHIHIAVTVTPKISISEWVQKVKSVSSLVVNRELTTLETAFRWQTDYGFYTLGKKAMPFLISYIAQQKERHATNNLEEYLERIPEDKD